MKDAGQVIPEELQMYAPTKKTFDSSSEEESDEEWQVTSELYLY